MRQLIGYIDPETNAIVLDQSYVEMPIKYQSVRYNPRLNGYSKLYLEVPKRIGRPRPKINIERFRKLYQAVKNKERTSAYVMKEFGLSKGVYYRCVKNYCKDFMKK